MWVGYAKPPSRRHTLHIEPGLRYTRWFVVEHEFVYGDHYFIRMTYIWRAVISYEDGSVQRPNYDRVWPDYGV